MKKSCSIRVRDGCHSELFRNNKYINLLKMPIKRDFCYDE